MCNDACHRRSNFRSHITATDGNCCGQQSYTGFHRQIGFPHISNNVAEQQLIQECDVHTSVPASNQIPSECQTKRAVCHQFVLEKRISRSGIPVNGPLQSKRELNVAVCQKCDWEKRVSQIHTPKGNTMRAECHEVILDCNECEMEDLRAVSEGSRGADIKHREMKNKFQLATSENDRVYIEGHTDIFGCQEYMLEKQRNSPEIDVGNNCHKCEFGERIFQGVLPGTKQVCFICQENSLCCQECALRKHIMAPEMERLIDCEQWCLDPSFENQTKLQCGVETRGKETVPQCNQEEKISSEESQHQYSDDGVHHKKKRAAALWQRLSRKRVSVNRRRKWISVAIVQPTSSAPRP
jgi:hypothetical protein